MIQPETVNAPVVNYTVEYIGNDPISRSIYHTVNIDTRDQRLYNDSEGIKVCKHEYNLSHHHQTDIIVNVSAINMFGRGPSVNTTIGNYMHIHIPISIIIMNFNAHATIIIIGFRNTFVMVIFYPKYSNVTCKFLTI